MTRRTAILLPFCALALWLAQICLAQYRERFPRPEVDRVPGKWIQIEGGDVINEDAVRTARETASHSTGLPEWTNAPSFDRDVFTFTRVIFQSESGSRRRGRFGPRLGWWVDYPDADLNLSWRLQQLTSIRTDPDGRVLKLSDPDLFNFPLLYMEHAGYLRLTDDEVSNLRRYLSNGGALFVNDFWSAEEWDGFAAEIKRVFPNLAWTELDTTHPLFHCVFELPGPMHRLRVPTMQFWNDDFDADDPNSPPHRVDRGEGSDKMTVRVLQDSASHVLVLAVHNSDLSDGWEREGENDHYFNHFSEKTAYPLAVNIIFYLMTH